MNKIPIDCLANIFEFVSNNENLFILIHTCKNFKNGIVCLFGRYNRVKSENINQEKEDFLRDPISYFYFKFMCEKCDRIKIEENICITGRCKSCLEKKKTNK